MGSRGQLVKCSREVSLQSRLSSRRFVLLTSRAAARRFRKAGGTEVFYALRAHRVRKAAPSSCSGLLARVSFHMHPACYRAHRAAHRPAAAVRSLRSAKGLSVHRSVTCLAHSLHYVMAVLGIQLQANEAKSRDDDDSPCP